MKLPLPTKTIEKKRLQEWYDWLKFFQTKHLQPGGSKKITYIPNAAWLLNDLYWRIAEQYLRELLSTTNEIENPHRIHPYKIISASEITIMMVLPIEADGDELLQKKANAFFAWFVATQIIEYWDTGDHIKITSEEINTIANYKENIDLSNNYPESFAAEHIKWLTYLNVTIEKPILLNAQCWRLFYLACLSLASKGKLSANK